MTVKIRKAIDRPVQTEQQRLERSHRESRARELMREIESRQRDWKRVRGLGVF